MNVEGSKHGLGTIGCVIVKTGSAMNNVEVTPKNGAWGQTSEGISVKLADIVGYPNGTNGLDMGMGMLVVPPVLGINSGNPGIELGGSLPLDQAYHISNMQRRNLMFSSADVDLGLDIIGVALSLGSMTWRLLSEDIGTLPFDLLK